MKQTLMIKLAPTETQHEILLETMERFNEACNCITGKAFELKTANKIRLQQCVYQNIRKDFGLSAQLTIRAISKVCEAYKRNKKIQPFFKPHGAVVYDQRILSFKGLDKVSILTLQGRQIIPIKIGTYQEARLDRIVRQTDLIYRNGIFYLAAIVDAPEPPVNNPDEFIGVDLGIKNIAFDSDGVQYSGNKVNALRKRHAKLRAKLQSKQTESANRLLKKRKRKEARFAKDVNHVISKKIVEKAKDTGRGIALENLTGIRSRTVVRKKQRRQHNSWGFYQLRQFIEYKAKIAGVLVSLVDPRNTSRTCPICGCIDKRNRKSQFNFSCITCGFSSIADYIAAINIGRRAAVNLPYAVSQIYSTELQATGL
ncbi:MAG: transposase [Candidatus Micrarchaeota archaeon]